MKLTNSVKIQFAGLLLLAASTLTLIRLNNARMPDLSTGGEGLTLYCAAGLAEPVQRIVERYEKETGRRINVQFGGSGSLLASLQVAKRGDLFLAADADTMDMARAKDLVAETIPLARLHPVILVKEGNPLGLRGLADLVRPDVRLALGDPQAAAVGKLSKAMLSEAGLWEAAEQSIRVRGLFRPTVNGMGTDVSTGPIDAAIVWDTVARQFDQVEALAFPEAAGKESQVAIGVLASAQNPTAALHFARFLSARDKGLPEFAADGFDILAGDVWADVPEVSFFSGSVNRVSIDERLRDFEAREGAKVNVVYNGCGILVSQMRAGAKPDAYFACDTSYMSDVYERFRDHRMVSATEMVIIAAPGNPKNIQGLEDLAKPGVRVAICNPEYSALGGLTHRLFRTMGLFERIMPNVTFGDAPTADTIVARVRTAREDAGIVYRANIMGLKGDLEVLDIAHPAATAAQPIAISVETGHNRLIERLVETLTAPGMRERYEASGFSFRVGEEYPVP